MTDKKEETAPLEKKTLTLGKGTLKLGEKGISSGNLEKKFAARSGTGDVSTARRPAPAAGPRPQGQGPQGRLSEGERQARLQALQTSPNMADQARRHVETEQQRREQRTSTARAEETRPASTDRYTPHKDKFTGHKVEGEDGEAPRKVEMDVARKPAARREGDYTRGGGKLTVTQALAFEDNEQYRMRSEAAFRRSQKKKKAILAGAQNQAAKVYREVVVPETITVQELANRMTERVSDVVKSLMKMGMMTTATQAIDADTAEIIVTEFGHKIKRVAESDVEDSIKAEVETDDNLSQRPPVVTIMGHVDHGKTSLLDALRSTDVAAGEAGGITQHIGAYQVTLKNNKKITFIDTPGHAAFSEMRARGANVTDIVILLVAADDGVKEQTVEALSHAKAAKVPMIVAINKIDMPGANPMKVKTELLQHEIIAEELGGEVQVVEVSAKQKKNLDKLEEAILVQAEVMDLKANPNRSAKGVVIESKQEIGKGSVATVLVQRGTLKIGDLFVTGSETGRVRALIDDKGKKIQEALPSFPVEVWGLNGAPLAGDDFVVVDSEAQAREIADFRLRQRKAEASAQGRSSLEQLFSQIKEGQAKEFAVVIKSDVQGSLEAIRTSLDKLSTPEVAVKILHGAVGEITESDITLARASNATVIGFNVRANAQARDAAKRDKIDIRYYSIIYNLIDDAKALLGGLLSPEIKETFVGYAQIREVFNITGAGKVAGCMITEGVVKRGNKVRLLRDNVVIHEGSLKTLKRFKDEVKEVTKGMECGIAFENYDDIKQGDMVECFEIEKVARTL